MYETHNRGYPPCYDECPLAKQLFDMTSHETQDSLTAERAYSKLFCLEAALQNGAKDPNALDKAVMYLDAASRAWSRYPYLTQAMFQLHSRIKTLHLEKIERLTARDRPVSSRIARSGNTARRLMF